jgi:HSP20 family protein
MRFSVMRTSDAGSTWDFDRVFDDFLSLGPLYDEGWTPRMEVTEDEKAIHVTAEMPGLSEKDINVTLEKNVLTISGEKNEEKKENNEKRNIVLSERRYGSFSRSIRVPQYVRADTVKAEFRNGVLTVELPKSEEARPRQIEVKVH